MATTWFAKVSLSDISADEICDEMFKNDKVRFEQNFFESLGTK